jgi:hypothetical protein
LLGPVAEKLGIDLVWFGILLSINMQTSFMHPPFGYALFYLRSVAPAKDYVDKVTRKPIARITSGQIYWGAVPFVLLQVLMVALVIAFPNLVSGGLAKRAPVNIDNIDIRIPDATLPGGGSAEDALEDVLSRALGSGGAGADKTPAPVPPPQGR